MSGKDESNEMWKRAELFNLIERLVRAHNGRLEDFLLPGEKNAPFAHGEEPPPVMILGSVVYFGRCSVDLAGRTTMLKLFRIFARSPGYEVARDKLLTELYEVKREDKTTRYIEATHNNAVKMISRARQLANKHLGTGRETGIEWFVYDLERKTWKLFRWYRDHAH